MIIQSLSSKLLTLKKKENPSYDVFSSICCHLVHLDNFDHIFKYLLELTECADPYSPVPVLQALRSHGWVINRSVTHLGSFSPASYEIFLAKHCCGSIFCLRQIRDHYSRKKKYLPDRHKKTLVEKHWCGCQIFWLRVMVMVKSFF